MPKLSKLQRRLSRMVKVAKGSVTIRRRRREGVQVEAATATVVEGKADRSFDSLDSSTSSDVCREEVEEGDGYRIHLTTAHDSSYEEVEEGDGYRIHLTTAHDSSYEEVEEGDGYRIHL